MQQGTGAIEIKSGYGLTTDAEMKMLRVAKKLGEKYNISSKNNFSRSTCHTYQHLQQ